jgi:hypothetical protein
MFSPFVLVVLSLPNRFSVDFLLDSYDNGAASKKQEQSVWCNFLHFYLSSLVIPRKTGGSSVCALSENNF